MSQADFTGFGLAVGSVKGLRSFKVDSLGRLTGVSMPEVWTPGENVAGCQRGTGMSMTISTSMAAVMGLPIPQTIEKKAPTDKHDRARCACGYYAYYKGEDNPHHSSGQVAAIIEGYGETVLGSKGYRAEKARIVALVVPRAKDAKNNWKSYLAWALVSAAGVGFSIDTLVTDGLLIGLACLIINALWLGWNTFNVLDIARVKWHSGHCSWHALHASGDCTFLPKSRRMRAMFRGETPVSDRLGLVRRNYADIPTFDSQKAMLAAFPADIAPMPEISPETVDDFWTRVAQ